MSKAKISQFMSNTGNRSLVFCLSLAAALAVAGPSAGSWLSARHERVEAEQTTLQLAEVQQAVAELEQQLETTGESAAELRSMAVKTEDVETFRNEIMELVRSSDCRLRNLTPGERTERRWMENDSVLSDRTEFDSLDTEPRETQYTLQIQNLELVVTGSFENLCELMDSIQSLKRLVHTNTLDIHAGAESGLRLHWDLSLISLVYSPTEEDDWDEDFEE